MVQHEDIELARRWAKFYRDRGLNPLPSRTDAKRPLVRFARWWESPAPGDLFDRFPTPCIQVMAGTRWRLVVIDLDGPEAAAQLARMGPPLPTTWVVHSGGGGRHVWLRTPEGHGPIPRAVLWRGTGRHAAIERLCERSLVMAPPSVHPRTGKRYRFLDHRNSPARLPLPAECPAWVLRLPPVDRPEPTPAAAPHPRLVRRPGPLIGRYRTAEVLAAIPDKTGLARSWGLRLTGRLAGRGALECRAIGREDRHPSAIFNPQTGRYWDPWLEDSRSISLFDLGARLGIYQDWREAVVDLGQEHRAREIVA